jgi:hypothetical protein
MKSRRSFGRLRQLPSGSWQAGYKNENNVYNHKTFRTKYLALKYLEQADRAMNGMNHHKYKIARGKRIRSYGIDVGEYEQRMRDQDCVCAICKKDNNGIALCIDHDHKTGVVRGLLCNTCNRALGLLKDDPTLLQNAINYLIIGVVPVEFIKEPLRLVK